MAQAHETCGDVDIMCGVDWTWRGVKCNFGHGMEFYVKGVSSVKDHITNLISVNDRDSPPMDP